MPGQISLTREQFLDSLSRLRTAAQEMANRLDMTQMTWQPDNGERWSVTECMDHVAISTELYLDAMELAIGEAAARGGAAELFRTAGWPSAKMVRDMEPPALTKWGAPGKLRPRPTLHPEGVLPQFLAAMDRVAALVASTAGKDLNAVRFRNPLIPLVRFTVASGFLIVAAHARRHIWQAEQNLQDPNFPPTAAHL